MGFLILHEFPTSQIELAWRECLARVECPAHYNAPEYFLVPHWAGRRPFAVLALDGSTVTGVLTGLHEPAQVMCGLASRPQICVDTNANLHAVTEDLARGLFLEAGTAGLVSVFTWQGLPLPAFERLGFRRKQLEGNVVLDLTQGTDALFKQFAKDRRRNVRFAEKNGVEVCMATTDADIAECYEVYRAWRHTERKKLTGEKTDLETFAKAARLAHRRMFVARVAGKPVAVNIFRLFPGGLFESASNYSRDEFLHLKPNELLQWRGIQWACSQGLRRHSLGGAHSFLRRFGGAVVPVVRYRFDRTWLRRHDLRESVLNMSRQTAQRMPALGRTVRRVLGRKTY